ncbi:helix-turn-helix domain-containing protein [Salirhabdus salicampi]|uniref:helix-turn-helix domain-containing protein n=1 Tax=Salirhabdus salicampi TaxID=476102 RepID=UPI0020C58021|nr:helix-turn-helix transcriptional regulator [Salirhabdus salicampi]MCP8618198.1 helix-turn-helix transcriptional regulator [Salirhabdus salicampi]
MGTDKWGRRIRAYRKLKGFTQVGFANALGYSTSIIGEVERGSRQPDEKLLRKVSEVLDIPLEELAPEDNN